MIKNNLHSNNNYAKKTCKFFLFSVIFFTASDFSQGQNTGKVIWAAKNPFEQKVVIENKGQYSIQDKVASKDILFGARQGGLQYYFTANSIWIKRAVAVKRTEDEIEKLKKQIGENENNGEKDDDKDLEYKQVDEFHEISFAGANPEAELTTDNEVNWYYNFTIDGNEVVAHAWKKLTYHNLYPGIDMEFYFPEDKEGFKYSFIVHPGADVAQIKIQYPLNEAVQLTGDNSVVQSPYGSFTDHAPVASQQGKGVNCSFSLTNSMIGFDVKEYDKTQDLVIDPWTITPTFTGVNSAYDVDWDKAGNCYVYGGSQPWQLIKYNSSGAMLWSYTEDFYIEANYGAFAVDRNSQSAYIVEGFGFGGAQVIKVNASGAQIADLDGNPIMNEMWRIAFSSCTNQAVIGAGGTSNTYQACYLDTTLTNLTPVNALNTSDCCHDIWGTALDNYGNCYMAAVHPNTSNYDSSYNIMVKLPLPSLTPETWRVNDGYKIEELFSVHFDGLPDRGNNANNATVGFNGMTISDTNLFTYNSYVLKKWNSATGALIDTITVNKTPISNHSYDGYAYDLMYWGGLTSDNFGHIFLGSTTYAQQYNSKLSVVNIYPLPDTVYDVKLAQNGILYTCGKGFVETIQVFQPVKIASQVINPSCNNLYGSAILTLSGGAPPYTVSWNTIPVQTGDTAVNLIPGTYIATIGTGSGCVVTDVYDTVTIQQLGKPLFDTVAACYGNAVTLTGAPQDNSYSWSPSAGLSSTTGSSVVANPTITTNYTVLGNNGSGCFDTTHYHFVVKPLPVLKVEPSTPAICDETSVTITASGALSYTWTPSTGLNSSADSVVIANPSITTTYTLTGVGTNGCSDSTTIVVDVGAQPKASFTAEQLNHCQPQNIQFVNNSTGGSSYSWNFGDGTTGTEVSPLHSYTKSGTYTITLVVTSIPGCADSIFLQQVVDLGSDDVFVPTGFTPGSDGENEYFSPNVLCTGVTNYIFRIYNRWGEMLYESMDKSQQGWDGIYNGVKQPMGTYVYYLEMNCGDCNYFKKGDITLIR